MSNGESKLTQSTYVSIGLILAVGTALLTLGIFAYTQIRIEFKEVRAEMRGERSQAIAPLQAEVAKNTAFRDSIQVKLNEISVTLAVMQKDIQSLEKSAGELLRSLKINPNRRE